MRWHALRPPLQQQQLLLLLLLVLAPRPSRAAAEQCAAGAQEQMPRAQVVHAGQAGLPGLPGLPGLQQTQQQHGAGAGPAAPAAAQSPAQGEAGQPALLALPSGDGDATQLALGQTLKLDKLGPIIVNSDGTTSRIVNWASLTERERQVALRRIAARNKERAAQLSQGSSKT
jgi:hypothetical protein